MAGIADLPARADVVVVGGGLAGCAAAAALAQGGVDVVVLEAESDLGYRGIGLLALGLAEPADRLAEALGDHDARDLYRFCAEDVALLRELGAAVETGGWWVANDQREAAALERAVEAAARLGVAVDRRADALFFPAEATFDGDRALRALRAGIRLVPGARVTRLVQGAGVRVGRRLVRAEAVVLAGGWRLPELDPWFSQRLVPVREQSLAVAGHASRAAGRTGWGWTSWWPAGDTTVVSGCRWATPNLEIGETTAEPTEPVQRRLEAAAARWLPGAPVLRRDAWIATHTCDNLPLVGPLPGVPTWIALAGFGPTAPSLAVRAGKAVADGLLTGRAPGLPARFAPSRLG